MLKRVNLRGAIDAQAGGTQIFPGPMRLSALRLVLADGDAAAGVTPDINDDFGHLRISAFGPNVSGTLVDVDDWTALWHRMRMNDGSVETDIVAGAETRCCLTIPMYAGRDRRNGLLIPAGNYIQVDMEGAGAAVLDDGTWEIYAEQGHVHCGYIVRTLQRELDLGAMRPYPLKADTSFICLRVTAGSTAPDRVYLTRDVSDNVYEGTWHGLRLGQLAEYDLDREFDEVIIDTVEPDSAVREMIEDNWEIKLQGGAGTLELTETHIEFVAALTQMSEAEVTREEAQIEQKTARLPEPSKQSILPVIPGSSAPVPSEAAVRAKKMALLRNATAVRVL